MSDEFPNPVELVKQCHIQNRTEIRQHNTVRQ